MFSFDQSLCAFGAGRNAMRKMHATLCVEMEGDQGDGSRSVPPCLCGEVCFVWVATPLATSVAKWPLAPPRGDGAERKRSDAAGTEILK